MVQVSRRLQQVILILPHQPLPAQHPTLPQIMIYTTNFQCLIYSSGLLTLRITRSFAYGRTAGHLRVAGKLQGKLHHVPRRVDVGLTICVNRTHLKTHVKPVVCRICSYQMAEASYMRKHLKCHKPAETRQQFVCPSCFEKFTRKDNLLRHGRALHQLEPIINP